MRPPCGTKLPGELPEWYFLRQLRLQLTQLLSCFQVLQLQEQVHRNPGQTFEQRASDVDTAQLLHIREQEHRQVVAEREQLQAELVRTHGMLGEQQDEVVRLQEVNQQVRKIGKGARRGLPWLGTFILS